MKYKLAVVVLLVIYFIFMYQTGTNADAYCMADNARDSNIAFSAMLGSLAIAFLFLAWAVYEDTLDSDAKYEISLLISEEKAQKRKRDYINAPDPNIKNAYQRNIKERGNDQTDSTDQTNIVSSPVYPTSDFNIYEAIDKSSERGNVHDKF
jgi:hypothetical protein